MERVERNRRPPSLYRLGKIGLTEIALEAKQTCVKGLESGKLTFTDNEFGATETPSSSPNTLTCLRNGRVTVYEGHSMVA